ncbi:MAG: hypothetical protein KI786_14415, partial [Mameliella sp.]|nr:hypothetical protein [Phaeodactylibacter sp.]
CFVLNDSIQTCRDLPSPENLFNQWPEYFNELQGAVVSPLVEEFLPFIETNLFWQVQIVPLK